MALQTDKQAGERTQTMNAEEILTHFGIFVDSERLSDASRVWNVLLSDGEINCISEKHARDLAFAIAVAIRNATTL